MTTITKYVVALFLCLFVANVDAQEEEGESQKKTDSINTVTYKKLKIDELNKIKEEIEIDEKENLMLLIESINQLLDKKEITASRAEELKKEAANKIALNIQNRVSNIDTRIEFVKRNGYDFKKSYNRDDGVSLSVGPDGIFIDLEPGKKKVKKEVKYDVRTRSDMVYAFGINNAIIDGVSIDDTPYQLGGSRFFELGYSWRTRVLQNSNFIRFNYGVSLQINGLKQKDNFFYVNNNGQTELVESVENLDKSKLSISNLVVPLHFEFGPSKKVERTNYIRYYTDPQFKVGIGGYAGFNIGNRQKLKFENQAGDRVKEKIRGDFNTSNFVYGLSGYVGVGGWAFYAKYDLSPIFRNQAIEQRNISFGVRIDFAR